jgi:hypothetical protein
MHASYRFCVKRHRLQRQPLLTAALAQQQISVCVGHSPANHSCLHVVAELQRLSAEGRMFTECLHHACALNMQVGCGRQYVV